MNTDAMPQAWLARFGRTVAEQVIEAVQGRLRAPPRAGMEASLAGQALPRWRCGPPRTRSTAGRAATADMTRLRLGPVRLAPLRLAYCWSNARRRLREIYDSSGSEIAAEGLRRIAELYAIEAEIRGCPPEGRLAERQARSAPLTLDFSDWLKQQRARISPKSRLGEKLAYIARHWDGLQLFLADGRVEMDSNAVENLARPIALSRKNALFAGHDEGAAGWGMGATVPLGIAGGAIFSLVGNRVGLALDQRKDDKDNES